MRFLTNTNLLTVVIVLLSLYARGQSDPQNPELVTKDSSLEDLDCSKPFISAAKDLMECKTLLHQGEIHIRVCLPRIELTPNEIMALGPGNEVGDFDVDFILTPLLSRSDLEKIQKLEKERIKSVKNKQQVNVPFRAHLKSQNNWYGIIEPLYFPAQQIDKDRVKEFIDRLSKACVTLEDKPAKKLLNELILGE